MELYCGKKSDETLDYLLKRRSASVKKMTGPGPSEDEIQRILKAGARVPDHGRTVPFYFIVFEGEARERAGEIIAAEFQKKNPDAPAEKVAEEKQRFLRAPLVVGVIYRARKAKHPLWEQMMSCGAVCQNILLAASSLGYGAQWLSEWYAYDVDVCSAFGLEDGRDQVAGFIHIGTSTEAPEERARPEMDAIVTRWEAGAAINKGDENDKEKFGFPNLGWILSCK